MTPTKDTVVHYDDPTHVYSYGGVRYLSSSQIVEKFTQPFDTWAVAEKYACKNGMTAEYWVEQWTKIKDDSLVRGNTIHDANDLSLNARMIDVIDGEVVPVVGDYYDDSYPWFQRPDGVYTERMLWHHGYKIAGRSDKIRLRTENGIRYADVEDYKTNKSIDLESFKPYKGKHKMMLYPVNYIMDCNAMHYNLQLSIYMFMLEYQGFVPGKMRIIHYPHPFGLQQPPPVYYEMSYLKREVVTILNHLKHG